MIIYLAANKFKNIKRSGLLLFSIIFVIIAGVVILYFVNHDLTFVRNGDSYTQHYPAFLYMGKWYRSAIHGLFSGQGLPPMWDFSIGYGLDAAQTLFFYGFYDFVSVIFSVFGNIDNGCWIYTLMMIFQAYLTGIAFILFCEKHNCSETGAAISAMAYVLCPYMLDAVFNGHPNFANPLMYLPLILLGIEKILREEKCIPYIFVVCFAILSSIYYFYMEILFAILYYVCRCFSLHKIKSIRKSLRSGVIISAYTLSGVFISMPLILPIITGLFSDERTNTSIPIPILYSVSEYERAAGNLISSDSFNYYGYLGVSACIFLGIIVLFASKGNRWIKVFWAVSLISCLVPFIGYFMNGMTYIANRHVWIFVMITCFVFAKQFNILFDLNKRIGVFSVVILLAYSILLIMTDNLYIKEKKIGLFLLILGLLISLAGITLKSKQYYKLVSSIMMSVLVLLGVFIHIHSIYVDRNGLDSFLSTNQVREIIDQYKDKYAVIKDETPWRMDWERIGRRANTSPVSSGKGSTYAYWSFMNSNLTKYLDMNGVISYPFETETLDGRFYLQALNAAKYYSSSKELDLAGYEKLNDDNTLYYNSNSLPVIRQYNSFVSESDYENMSYAEREKIQSLYCVALEDNIKNADRVSTESYKSMNMVEYEVETIDNVVTDNTIIINNPDEPIIYYFDCPAGGSLYYEIIGLSDCASDIVIWAECDNESTSITHASPSNLYYWGKHDYLFNMGYSTENRTSLNIWFSQKGEYTYDFIRMEYTSYDEFLSTMSYIKESGIESTIIEGDTISANVNLNENTIIYCSIPYSQGWKMYVDGIEKPVFRANIMGIGAEIEAGTHKIVLKYNVPYLGFGIGLAIIGIIGVIVIWKKHAKPVDIENI